ncbi:MAG: hypothetical protein ACRDQ5_27120 [Sciscionella sp.]
MGDLVARGVPDRDGQRVHDRDQHALAAAPGGDPAVVVPVVEVFPLIAATAATPRMRVRLALPLRV